MLIQNALKEKLNKGKPVLGIWNTLASPLATEVFSQAGLDFQIIDLEHGPFIIDDVHLHVSACENSMKCTPLARVPVNSDWMTLQLLDQGIHGVVAPHIDSLESAQYFVNSSKYHPYGNRGFTPFSKASGFTDKEIPFYIKRSVSESINVVIIESRDGLNNLEEILSVDGVDIVYFGAYDLSQDLGYFGNTKHPKVVQEIQKGVEKVRRSGKFAGGFVPQSKDEIKWLLDMGMMFISYNVDSSIIYEQTQNVVNWFSDE